MSRIKNYLSLIKFSHTLFAMPFALIGFFLGISPLLFSNWKSSSLPDWHNTVVTAGFKYSQDFRHYPQNGWQAALRLLLVVLCMIFARSAAMAFNRYLDDQFDARNPRTALREIPAGIISRKSALRFVILNGLAFILCTWFINSLCFYLSFVALFLVLGYSYTKRFTPFCHLILGLSLSLAPIGAYLAVTGHFDILPILFSFTVIFWVSGFDIIYALQDEEFDRSQDLYSLPSWLGKAKALRASELLHLISSIFLVAAGFIGFFGWWYWAGVVLFLGMLVYQHSIVKPNDLTRINLAFMTANGIASVVFSLFVIVDIFQK
jgi:4-hydroxybenzoate polyprenyltransferase